MARGNRNTAANTQAQTSTVETVVEETVAKLEHTQLEVVKVSTNSKALSLMESAKSTKDRADKYTDRIARRLQNEELEVIQNKIEALEDKIFDLENINLTTNLNRGQSELTQEEVYRRFKEILDVSYQKDLLTAEYNSKVRAFNTYFG